MDMESKNLPTTHLRLSAGDTLRCEIATEGSVYYRGTSGIIVGASYDTEDLGCLLHLSASYATHVPSWPKLLDVQAAFARRVPMMMVLPRRSHHINNHPYCLHLYEIPQTWHGHLDLTHVPARRSSASEIADLHAEGIDLPYGRSGWACSIRRLMPDYATLLTFRSIFFAPGRDVMLWWDVPGAKKSQRTWVYMAYTPSPWHAGAGVGVPGFALTPQGV